MDPLLALLTFIYNYVYSPLWNSITAAFTWIGDNPVEGSAVLLLGAAASWWVRQLTRG